MRVLIQAFCVLVIAVGSGLLAFGTHLAPQFNALDPAALARSFDRDDHMTASITSGVGIGCMILGTLGLVIPLFSRLGSVLTSELSDNSSRTLTAAAIWFSVALILTFGVFRVNWTGATGMSVILMLVTLFCAAATASTAMAYGWKPWIHARRGGCDSELPSAP